MESHAIPDVRISASSMYDQNHGPNNARLNFEGTKHRTSAWSAKTNDENQWLQVDFVRPVQVTHVLTQGRGDCCNQFVSSYSISYSQDSSTYETYMQNGSVVVRGVCFYECGRCTEMISIMSDVRQQWFMAQNNHSSYWTNVTFASATGGMTKHRIILPRFYATFKNRGLPFSHVTKSSNDKCGITAESLRQLNC